MIWDEPDIYEVPAIIIPPAPPLEIEGVRWAKVHGKTKNHSGGRYHAWRNGEPGCHVSKLHGASKKSRGRIPSRACRECLARLQGASTAGFLATVGVSS